MENPHHEEEIFLPIFSSINFYDVLFLPFEALFGLCAEELRVTSLYDRDDAQERCRIVVFYMDLV